MTLTYTIAMIKPDVWAAGRVPELLRDIERDYEIGLMLTKQWQPQDVAHFYAELNGREFWGRFMQFMTSAPMVAMALIAPNAVEVWRERIGPTDPKAGGHSCLRYLYGSHVGPIMMNAVHGSSSEDERDAELNRLATIFFGTSGTHLKAVIDARIEAVKLDAHMHHIKYWASREP